MQIYTLNLRNYANYALCSDSAIMPESNAGIIGLAQPTLEIGDPLRSGMYSQLTGELRE